MTSKSKWQKRKEGRKERKEKKRRKENKRRERLLVEAIAGKNNIQEAPLITYFKAKKES